MVKKGVHEASGYSVCVCVLAGECWNCYGRYCAYFRQPFVSYVMLRLRFQSRLGCVFGLVRGIERGPKTNQFLEFGKSEHRPRVQNVKSK